LDTLLLSVLIGEIISLPKWEGNKEEEEEKDHEVCLMEEQEEVVEEADEGELLLLRRALRNQMREHLPL